MPSRKPLQVNDAEKAGQFSGVRNFLNLDWAFVAFCETTMRTRHARAPAGLDARDPSRTPALRQLAAMFHTAGSGPVPPFAATTAILAFYVEALHTAEEYLRGATWGDPNLPPEQWQKRTIALSVATSELAESGAQWGLTEQDVRRVFLLERPPSPTEQRTYRAKPEARAAWLLVIMTKRMCGAEIPEDDNDAISVLDREGESMKRWLRRVKKLHAVDR